MKKYKDSTLKGITKDELIGIIRCLEHNIEVVEQMNDNQFKLLMEKEKYRWHDLRKNPEDLPNGDLFFRNILVTDGTYYMTDCAVCVNDKMCCISAESEETIMYNVIAWREIEPFEEEYV